MKLLNVLSMLLCGLSIGWLMGLTTSPVIQTIISSILVLITSCLSVISGIQNNSLADDLKKKLGTINALPLGIFLIGLSFAATLGIYARTNEWFGVNPLSFKKKWVMKDRDSSGIILNLYNSLYDPKNTKISENDIFSAKLFRVPASMIDELKVADSFSDIKTVLKDIAENDAEFKAKFENCSDSSCIIRLRNQLIKSQ